MPMFSYRRPRACWVGRPAVVVDVQIGTISVRWEYDARQSGLPALAERARAPGRNTDGQARSREQRGDPGPAYRPSPVDAGSPEAVTIGGGEACVLSGGNGATGRWAQLTAGGRSR